MVFLASLFLDLVLGGVGNEEKINPSSGKLGFSTGQFQTFYFKRSHKNTSSIFIPSAAVDQRGKFRSTDKFIIHVIKKTQPISSCLHSFPYRFSSVKSFQHVRQCIMNLTFKCIDQSFSTFFRCFFFMNIKFSLFLLTTNFQAETFYSRSMF